jgi:hypothetical protein
VIHPIPRREFLRTAALTGGAALGLPALPPVPAQEARLAPEAVRLDPEIEPLVRLIEDTPREKLVEEVAARIRRGLSYREVLAALLLAGVRNVQPRPVGFKFHAVLVVHSAHLAALSAPDEDRWLPLLWAVDHFKGPQAEERRKTGWRMGSLDPSRVPPASRAEREFVEGMESWDPDRAEPAAAALARSAGAGAAFELFARYAARDFRDIGHKAIYVAGAFRALGVIGWSHAEPVLRSLTQALLYHSGESPARTEQAPDRSGRRNREALGRLRADWAEGKSDPAAARELLSTFRTGGEEEASRAALEAVNRGVAVRSVWDAAFTFGAELVARRPNILSLHALTTLNALRHIFEASASDETRRFVLLQAAAFLPFFRGRLERELAIDRLEPEAPSAAGADAVGEIFSDLSRDRTLAARKALGYLRAGGDARALAQAARVLVFLKGTNAHDYKYSSAVLEDYGALSPGWREPYLAGSLFLLRGAGDPDSGLAARVRAALRG